MVKINENFRKFEGESYLFKEIADRTAAFVLEHPDAKTDIIRMGIGDVTEPLPRIITAAMADAATRLSHRRGYPLSEIRKIVDPTKRKIRYLLHEAGLDRFNGYGAEQGNRLLREMISEVKYGGVYGADEIFVSDGAKCDSAAIQKIFSLDSRIALQCPAYPVYEGSNVIAGRTKKVNSATGRFPGLIYLECTPENDFFPDLSGVKADLLYICSPNNPTGAAATTEQLEGAVRWAMQNGAIIIYDSAYESFISEKGIPRSIYEINDAEKCAIEIGSFSKQFGFTGVRLGWTVVPKSLETENTDKPANFTLNWAWNKRMCTEFNGANNVSQAAGIAALTPEGIEASQQILDFYMENAGIIRKALEETGAPVFGGINAPYVWARVGDDSWAYFQDMLERKYIVCTPGKGFGGEGYIRFSAFQSRENVEKAAERIRGL
ncbi:LL-diaminopimelate aminotransferase [Candidatus Woesearchaeota archaeon]|nr:LL-diaminopimelate aminotransferase [Candidatus Woesearchaeota archaeon]